MRRSLVARSFPHSVATDHTSFGTGRLATAIMTPARDAQGAPRPARRGTPKLLDASLDVEDHLLRWVAPEPRDRARHEVGMDGFPFHDLRRTPTHRRRGRGASTKELMARMGHASARAALTYQHASTERDVVIADRLSAMTKEALGNSADRPKPDEPRRHSAGSERNGRGCSQMWSVVSRAWSVCGVRRCDRLVERQTALHSPLVTSTGVESGRPGSNWHHQLGRVKSRTSPNPRELFRQVRAVCVRRRIGLNVGVRGIFAG